MQDQFRKCEHPECSQPASSRVGGMYEGHWQGDAVVTCINHVNHFLASPRFKGVTLYVGVLDRRA